MWVWEGKCVDGGTGRQEETGINECMRSSINGTNPTHLRGRRAVGNISFERCVWGTNAGCVCSFPSYWLWWLQNPVCSQHLLKAASINAGHALHHNAKHLCQGTAALFEFEHPLHETSADVASPYGQR